MSTPTVKIGGERVSVDPQLLLQRLLHVAGGDLSKLEDIFQYELTALPSSLFDDSGFMRESSKHLFAKHLWDASEGCKQEMLRTKDVHYILDRGSLIHQLSWLRGTSYKHLAGPIFMKLYMRVEKSTTMTKLMCAVSLLVVACFFVKYVSAAAADLGTGSVRLQPYCSLARPNSRNSASVQCLVDSRDPSSSVTWSLVSQNGQVQDLGTCTGLRASCTSTGGDPDISLSRWYSWSIATINNFDQKVGDELVCSATHQGTEKSDRCVIGGQNQLAGYADCTMGESACRDKGWSISGIMNSIVVCCPAGQGLIMDMGNRQHPCRCNSGRR